MFLVRHVVSITSDADGNGTGYTPEVNGFIQSICYVKPAEGGYADGVDFDVTGEESGIVIWDQDNVNATATVTPKQATHSTAGVAALYAAGGAAVLDKIPVCDERVKIVVASGGDTKVGEFHVYVGG
jgi:hypothetical protein